MNKDVPFIIYEGTMSRFERTVKRLWMTTILLIVFLVGTNIAWLMYESHFEKSTTTTQRVMQSSDGKMASNVFVGGDYGEGKTDSNYNNND